jgi:hypothetical protein
MIQKPKSKKLFKWVGYFFIAFFIFLCIAFTVAYIKREEIKQGIVELLNERVNGTFAVEKINFTIIHQFPTFSISLQQVTLVDTVGKVPVLTAEKIFLDIGFYALFRNQIHIKKVSIENAIVFIYRDMEGYSNSSVFKKSKSDSTVSVPGEEEEGYSLNLNTLDFKNLNFNYIDSLKGKKIIFQFHKTNQILNQIADLTEIEMKGKVHCTELTFNNKAGGFLTDKSFTINLRLQYDKLKQTLIVDPTTLKFEDDLIKIAGEFLLAEGLFSLHIQSEQLLLTDGLSYVNNRIKTKVEQFSVDKPIDVDVKIQGKLKGGNEPQVDVGFHGEDLKFAFGKIRMQKVTCTGQYLHRPDSTSKEDKLSSVNIQQFRATLEGIPFEGKVIFTKLYDPVMDLSMKSKLTPAMFNKLVDTTEWISRSGTFSSSVKYKGRVEEYFDSTSVKYNGKLSGDFWAREGSFEYKPKNLFLKNVNGHCHFNEKQFTIDTLRVTFNGSPIIIRGSMKNYIPFFIQPANKGYVTLDLRSPHLDLSFIASDQSDEKKTKQQIRENNKKMTSVINAVQRKLQFDISLNAENFTYKKFNAKSIRGLVRLDGDILEAPKIQMEVAEGEMVTRLFLRSDDNNRKFISVNTQVRNANIREFFLMFNNFNQKTIRAENLEGTISADANFSGEVLPNYTINAPSMKGNITCTIRDGRLINFEPLQNISNFLFKRRDFADVQFAELQSYFDVSGTNIDIDRMEVQSSVMSFFVQGRYSFTDSTSMSLQIPLSNLKKRDKNFKPENVGQDPKRGMSVFLHIYRDKDINSKINIAYDPFKKWVKKV